jgi:PhnB protein
MPAWPAPTRAGVCSRFINYLFSERNGHMRLTTHLNFNGQCQDAFKLYEKCLGGKIQMMMSYQDSPMANTVPADWRNKVLHVSMTVGDQVLMGADSPPDRYKQPDGFAVTVNTSDPAEAERIFNTLADRGSVQMPLQSTFWAKKFGMLTDRFGTPWMINCGEPQ